MLTGQHDKNAVYTHTASDWQPRGSCLLSLNSIMLGFHSRPSEANSLPLSIPSRSPGAPPPQPVLKILTRHPTHTVSAPSPICTHAKLNMLLTIFNAAKLNLLKCNYLRRLAYCKWVSFIAFAVSLYLSRQFKDATESVPCQWGHVQLQRQ